MYGRRNTMSEAEQPPSLVEQVEELYQRVDARWFAIFNKMLEEIHGE